MQALQSAEIGGKSMGQECARDIAIHGERIESACFVENKGHFDLAVNVRWCCHQWSQHGLGNQ
jgi:hypothetical protein